jgi:CPA2 family monovalent cation:H+ antiporter-2
LEDLGLVGDLAVVGAAALVGGSVARMLRLPAVIGYLAAGVANGPNTPGLVGDVRRPARLRTWRRALMFTIGIASLRDLADAGPMIAMVATVQSSRSWPPTGFAASWPDDRAGVCLGAAPPSPAR